MSAQQRLRSADTWLFDLDNTLYPAHHNLFDQIDQRMGAYIQELLDLDAAGAREIQKNYFHKHGTTLRGLMIHHDVDADEYLQFVHDIDLSPIPENPRLAKILAELPGRKLIYTNGSADHAGRVLAQIGIDDHFEDVFDVVAAEFIPKPEPDSFTRMLDHFDITPDSTVFFEDLARNLEPAKAAGMTTVWVRGKVAEPFAAEGADQGHVDFTTEDLTSFLEALV